MYLLFDVFCGAFHGSLSVGHADLLISRTQCDVPVVSNGQEWIVKAHRCNLDEVFKLIRHLNIPCPAEETFIFLVLTRHDLM